MSAKYPGGFITKNYVPPTPAAAPGIWTLDQQLQAQKTGTWPFGGPFNYIEDVFSTYLYKPAADFTGYSINNGIDLAGEGGMTWFKARNAAQNNIVYDTVRGSTSGSPNALITNGTQAQQTAFFDYVTPTSTGFDVSFLSGGGQLTNGGINYASWTFRKQPKFFDIVTYTGNSTNRTIAHNLGSVPGTIIIKRTDIAAGWPVYHRSLGATKYIILNTANASGTYSGYWNDTEPTDSVFSLGGISGEVNATGGTYVAYLFAHDAGGFGESGEENVVSCGSFSTAASGYVSVDLGYEPQFVLWKKTSATQNWNMADNMRGFTSSSANLLYPNLTLYETEGALIRTTATGFEIDSAYWGASSDFIYIAIRRGPMKVPTLGTSVFAPIARTGTGTVSSTTGLSFPPDMLLGACRSDASGGFLYDKLRGVDAYLTTNNDGAEYIASGEVNSFNMDGITFGTNPTIQVTNVSARTYANWNFRRAPGFFDEVCTNVFVDGTLVNHNLGVTPELIIVKTRDVASNWMGAVNDSGNIRNLSVNTTSGGYLPSLVYSSYFNATTINPTGIRNGGGGSSKGNPLPVVAYLFATCPGVSKVGSYTGTGGTQTIACGFTTGARFVLIKRTDSTGDWYVWDSARGIVAGNDPYLLLNSTAAEVTTTDYVDTAATGFEISSTAPAAINASGGTFIFLAIA